MEVINQFRLKFDKSKIRRNAYLSCKSNPVCSEVVSESDTEILQYLYTQAYSKLSDTPMTNKEWDNARQKAESYQKISQNKSSDDWADLVDDYYMKKAATRSTEATTISEDLITKLTESITENKAIAAAALAAAEDLAK
jgi:hypothetical protein